MKPVFVTDQLGCLYQSGYRQLEKLAPEPRQHLAEELSLVLAVSPRTCSWLWPMREPRHAAWHLPFGDNRQWKGPEDKLHLVILQSAYLLRQGHNVLVYCFYGRNRSGLVAALIIREILGVTGAEALGLLRRGRKGAVGGNPHFVSYLEGLEAP